MKFYYFGGSFNAGDKENLETAPILEKHNFDGVMFTYDSTQGDMFVRTARKIELGKKIKYLIAIRPYTISPQYLQTIHNSMDEIDKDRLQFNFVSGYVKDHEEDTGGIVGSLVDSSDAVSKSKYMIKFIKVLNNMKINRTPLDFYISATNNYIFEEAKKYNNKIILPYNIYKRGYWLESYEGTSSMIELNIKNTEIMLALTPIIRKTEKELESLKNYALRPIWKKEEKSTVVDDVEYFTYEGFSDFVETLEQKGIKHLLINAVPRDEVHIIVKFIKQYVESKQTKNEEE
jgi:hypothetical protein